MPTAPDRWYLDTSAIVKLFIPEAESGALQNAMRSAEAATSVVGLIETRRALGRTSPEGEVAARLEEVLAGFFVVPLDPEVVTSASMMPPWALRSLDAIHLASALSLQPAISSFVTYDRRLAEAATEAGLRVLSPR